MIPQSVIREVLDNYENCCALCHRQVELQVHHKELKGMGGRKRDKKKWSDSLENLMPLCVVCHSAIHHIKVIGDFNCDVCQFQCQYSQRRPLG